MRRRAWGWLLAIPLALFLTVTLTEPFALFHLHLDLAGTPGRFAGTAVRAGRSDARAALWLDNVFAIAWLAIVPGLLQAGRDRWTPERRTMFGTWAMVPALAVAAGVADLVENLLALAAVGKDHPPLALTLVLVTVAWLKLLLYLVAVVGVFALVVGPLTAPWIRPVMRRVFGQLDRLAGSHPAPPERPTDDIAEVTGPDPQASSGSDGGPQIGICLSGGGIRAASVGLGALRGFDRVPDAAAAAAASSLFRRARWLVAVSGGSYTAGGWRITRRPGASVPPPEQAVRDGLFGADTPWATTVRRRRHFVANGALGVVTGALNVLARTVVVFGAVLAATYLIAAGAGRLVRSRVVHPAFPLSEVTGEPLGLRDFLALRLVVPVVVVFVLSVVFTVAARRRPIGAHRSGLVRVARGWLVAGGVLALALIGVPLGVRYGNALLGALSPSSDPNSAAGLLGVVALVGVVVTVVVVVLAVTGTTKVRVMQLGGVLLGVVLFLGGGKVADSIAYGARSLWTTWPLPFGAARLPVAAVAAAWLGLVGLIASHRLTLGGVYRKRVAATFGLSDRVAGDGTLHPLSYSAEPLWPSYRGAAGPELIVAATAHTSSGAFDGVKAYGFTFRPGSISLHDRPDGDSAVIDTLDYPVGSWWDGYPRGWLVSRSMALSGAAFASAMGRAALGSTNQLLVALNLRLGAWLPNPRYVRWFADPAVAPRVHLGYLAKELFGRYRPERDPFVYVADGGHRDNLGLVEAVRERPDVVCCIDASADPPGTFAALNEALSLARAELGVEIDIEAGLARLRGATGSTLPADCVAEGVMRYPASSGGGTARLLYGCAQVSAVAPQGLRDYAALHPPFPRYSTFDQFLDDDEHLMLVALGEHVATRMVERFEQGTA